MKKTTLRKALAPAALAIVLLTTGCDTAAVDSIKESATDAISSAAAPITTPLAEAVQPVPAPPAAPAPAAQTDEVAKVVAEAKGKVETIPVKGRAPKTGYDRDNFGPAWADIDHNGCDTRNDILARDLTDETFKDGTKQCVVATGVLQDKYTGTTINFVRGQDTSTLVQIDHLISLSNSWQTGAQQLSAEQRKQLSNDPINLMASDGSANMQKGDKDAATWLPANKSFRCEYVAKQTMVKAKYELWMTQAEKDAIVGILQSCN